MGDALTFAAAAQAPEFFKALARRGRDGSDGTAADPRHARVAEHYARGGPVDSIGAILATPGRAEAAGARRHHRRPREGLAAGQGAEARRRRGAGDRRAPADALARGPRPDARARLALGRRRGSTRSSPSSRRDFLAAASDASKPEAARIDAARQLIDLRKTDPQAARDVIALVTAKTPPDLASGLIGAVARSDSPEVGPALVDAMGPMTPAARKASVLALLGKTDWTSALVSGIEAGKVAMSLLSLDQSQALAAHPDSSDRRAGQGPARQGGRPARPGSREGHPGAGADRPEGRRRRRAARRSSRRNAPSATRTRARGARSARTSPAWPRIPKSELIVHILDPSRSVEGNFLQYTVSTADGRVLNGLLAGETKTSIDLLDAEGKKQTLLREDIEELAASKKSIMPEGFEKSVPPEGLADLLAVPHAEGEVPAAGPPQGRHASPRPRGCLSDPGRTVGRLVFEDWGPKVVDGVPFALVDPQGDRVAERDHAARPERDGSRRRCRSRSRLPVNATARAIHLLSGVADPGIPGGPRGDRLDDRPHPL